MIFLYLFDQAYNSYHENTEKIFIFLPSRDTVLNTAQWKTVIGFSTGCSDKKGNRNVTRIVESIMTRSDHEFEIVLLSEKIYSGNGDI